MRSGWPNPVPKPKDLLIVRRGRLGCELSPMEVLTAVREGFAGLATGQTIQPPQMLAALPDGRGDVIAYFGLLAREGAFGVKLSPYFPERPNGTQVTSWTLVMSMATGDPMLLCDSLDLTIERTAATTMLALEYLLDSEARSLAVIGLGPIGVAHLRYAVNTREWDRISLFSRSYAQNPSFLDRIPENLRRKASIAPSVEEAVGQSDVILLCTSSALPVIDYRWLQSTSVVTSIATNAPDAHEISPEALLHCDVFCDYRSTTPGTAGEMILAAREYGWSSDLILADIPEMINGRGKRPTRKVPIFFRSVGLGIEDIAIANLLLSRMAPEGERSLISRQS